MAIKRILPPTDSAFAQTARLHRLAFPSKPDPQGGSEIQNRFPGTFSTAPTRGGREVCRSDIYVRHTCDPAFFRCPVMGRIYAAPTSEARLMRENPPPREVRQPYGFIPIHGAVGTRHEGLSLRYPSGEITKPAAPWTTKPRPHVCAGGAAPGVAGQEVRATARSSLAARSPAA